jgi:hypothetical protein
MKFQIVRPVKVTQSVETGCGAIGSICHALKCTAHHT